MAGHPPEHATKTTQNWQTREIAQASIPLRVVGRSCGKFYPDLQRSKSNLLPTSQKVSQKSSLKIPTKHATKNQCWRRISPNFGSYRGQRHHRRQSRTQPSKVWRRNRLWLIPKEVIRQVPSTFIRRLCKWEAGNSRKIQPPLPYKLPVCYVCMYVCHLCVVYMYVCNSLYL